MDAGVSQREIPPGVMDPVRSSDAEAEDTSFAEDLQKRCQLLLTELEEFQAFLRSQKKEDTVELRSFQSDIRTELKLLDKFLSSESLNRQKAIQTVKSSNFPFHDAIWATAKRCTGITALRKRFYRDGREKEFRHNLPPKNVANSALENIVSENGQQWTKVSTMTERKIIFDLAEAGWVEDESDKSEDGFQQNEVGDEPEGLLKQVQCLVKASLANKSNYRWPRISLVLTRVDSNCQKPVADIINKTRALDVKVILSDSIPSTPPVQAGLQQMTLDSFANFSDILNVDCTMLLAFVSDLSHGQVEPQDWHHRFLSRQIEMESKTQLLPDTVWPACGARKLVCTREAAVRMKEIVEEIGTAQEKTRAELLLDDTNSLTHPQRIQQFEQLSSYKVPKEWSIPISTISISLETIKPDLPSVAEKVIEIPSPLNQSVFCYGWATGRTTISSNRATAKDIKAVIERNCLNEEVEGPEIWLSPMSRSLVGKEKRGGKERD